MAQSMFEKYAGKIIDCTMDGFDGKFDAMMQFPSHPSIHHVSVDAEGSKYSILVAVYVAIDRCENAESDGSKPNFFYS